MSILCSGETDLRPGTILAGRYQLIELIGEGGMGAVFKARDIESGRVVALKRLQLLEEGPQREKMLASFQREAETLMALDHPGIPKVMDLFTLRDTPYLVMQFIEGPSLHEMLGPGPLEAEQALNICIGICDILSYIHEQDPPIIHRDVKPQNVIVRPNGEVSLVDFGIARDHQCSQTKTMIGTMGFAPIEQIKGHPEPRSDIYALGATLYQLLTREALKPFEALDLTVARPDLPEVAQLITRATKEQLEQRFLSARLMRRALVNCVKKLGAEPPKPVSSPPQRLQLPEPLTRTLSTSGFANLLLAGLAFGLCVLMVLFLASRTPRPAVENEEAPRLQTLGEVSPNTQAGPSLWFAQPSQWQLVAGRGLGKDQWLRGQPGQPAEAVLRTRQLGQLEELSFQVLRDGKASGFYLALPGVAVACTPIPDSQDEYASHLLRPDGSTSTLIRHHHPVFGMGGFYRLNSDGENLSLSLDGEVTTLTGVGPIQVRDLTLTLNQGQGEQALQFNSLSLTTR